MPIRIGLDWLARSRLGTSGPASLIATMISLLIATLSEASSVMLFAITIATATGLTFKLGLAPVGVASFFAVTPLIAIFMTTFACFRLRTAGTFDFTSDFVFFLALGPAASAVFFADFVRFARAIIENVRHAYSVTAIRV